MPNAISLFDDAQCLYSQSINQSISQTAVSQAVVYLHTASMRRNLPVALLDILENWFKYCVSSVKWNHIFSYTFAIKFGVRQGSVLSPIMFAIYLNDVHAARSLTPRSYIILYTLMIFY